MLKIAIGDWLISRSDSFRLLMFKVRDHMIATKNSFSKIKGKHRDYEEKLEEYEARIRELESIIKGTSSVQIKIKKKKLED